jgi:sporulation protein YqfC
MLDKIADYIRDSVFKMEILRNSIYIANFTNIVTLEETRISVTDNQRLIVITGNNLVVSCLLDKEILITGDVKKVELG